MTDEIRLRTPQQIADAVECAIGLNVDCGGTEGVHRVRDAVLAAIQPALARLAEYENTINWLTTCTSCARVLDSSIQETERAERAEAALARVRSLADRWDNALGIDKTYARTLRAALDEPGPAAGGCSAPGPRTEPNNHSPA